MEVVLGFFTSNRNAKGASVAVSFEPGGASIARVKRDPSGGAALEFAGGISFTSEEERVAHLEGLVRQQQLQNSSCIAVLSADSYQLNQTDLADLPVEERRDAARWQIRERLDYPADESVIDLFEVTPFGGEKRSLTYIVSAQKKLLRDRIQLIEQCDLSVQAIDIPEFALRNICELFTEDERGLAILLLLEKSGVLVIVREGILYLVRWLSTGMDDLLPFADGNEDALSEQLDTIILEVQRSFDYCESTFHLPMVSRLLVAQVKQGIPAVINYLNDYLATAVEALDFKDVLSVPEKSDQLQLNRYLFAIGGALRQESR